MPDFKHFSDTFPAPPISPLQGNDFDYEQWDNITAKIKLVNVPWDIDYNNVVEFATVADRDLYFDSLAGYSQELNIGFRNIPGQYVKIPIPYANTVQYNYAIIDYPIPPNSTKPLDYAANPIAYRRMLYFITDIDDTAPNTTRVLLELDSWQMYYKSCELKNLMLERGHYAVANSASVSDYLSNPATHTDWLLEPEPFELQHIKKGATVVNVLPAASDLLVCFFLPFNITTLADFNTYADKTYNAGVLPAYDVNNDLTSNIKYSLTNNDTYEPTLSDTGGPNNFNGIYQDVLYCVKNTEFLDFINLLKSSYKYLLNNIKQFYMLSTTYLTIDSQNEITIDTNIHLYKVTTKNGHTSIVTLSTLFATYASGIKYTKLLTSPFANIEYIFPDGTKIEFETQSCAETIDLNMFLNLTDILTMRCEFRNINYFGNGNVNVLNFETNTAQSIVFNACDIIYHDINIPMFFIKIKPYEWAKYQKSAQRSELNEQLKTVYENEKISLANAQGNALGRSATNKTNADAKANASYNNALDLNMTTQGVNNDLAFTNETIALNNSATAYGNTTRSNAATSANATAQQGMNSALTTTNQAYNNSMNSVNISRNYSATVAQNTLQMAVVETQNAASVAQSVTGAINSVAGADLVGAVLGSVSTAIGVAADTVKANAIVANNTDMYNATVNIDNYSTAETNSYLTDKVTTQNSYIATSTYNTVTASDTNALDTYNAQNGNATALYNTQVANNAAILTTADANATRTNTTDLAVNTANKTLADNIANNDFAAGLNIAKNNVELEYLKNNYSITEDSFEPVTYISKFDYTAIEQFKGPTIRINVNGLKHDTLVKIMDFFTRYGYAAGGRVINSAVLQVMKYYTYVQARDVIVKPISCTAKQAKIIHDILIRGCTVYSNPDNIGLYFDQD